MMDWLEILAIAINSVFVLGVIQALKNYALPFLRAKHAWALPLIATSAGPLMAYLTEFLVGVTGHPIDLSGITAIFTGTIAVVSYGVLRKTGRANQGKISAKKKERMRRSQ